MWRTVMKKARIINGKYVGRIGMATAPNEVGNVMFYPVEGEFPYRVCLSVVDICYMED